MGGDIHAIPDDVLELILLRLASPLYLIRAATTCKRWHGIVAGTRFLSRFRSLNGLHLVAGSYHNARLLRSSEPERAPAAFVVGSYHNDCFQDSSEPEPDPEFAPPAFVPSSAPAAGGVNGDRFSLDFLWKPDEVVDPYAWKIKDSRGGLLLWAIEERYDCNTTWTLQMVVCDPLARRYRTIPTLVKSDRYHIHSGPFLLDGDGRRDKVAAGCGIDLSSFRVMCVIRDHRRGRYRVSMFISRYNRDRGSWRGYSVEGQMMRHFMGHTRASLYWLGEGRTVTALDRSTAEFSCSELPGAEADWDGRSTALKVAAGRDGEARLLARWSGGVLKVFALPQGGGEWAHEKTIELSAVARGLPGYRPKYFSGEVAKWLLWREESWACRLDIEGDVAFPCELPWPPVLRHRARKLPAGV